MLFIFGAAHPRSVHLLLQVSPIWPFSISNCNWSFSFHIFFEIVCSSSGCRPAPPMCAAAPGVSLLIPDRWVVTTVSFEGSRLNVEIFVLGIRLVGDGITSVVKLFPNKLMEAGRRNRARAGTKEGARGAPQLTNGCDAFR